MYPERHLNQLAAQKATLQLSIGLRRSQCVVALAGVARPFNWLDRALAFWRQLSPMVQMAAVPLGLFVTRRVLPKGRLIGSLLKWGPIAFGVVRSMMANRS